MRKIFVCMLIWVGIVFDASGMSRVRELSQLSILKKNPGDRKLNPQSIRFVRPIMRESASRTIKEIEKDSQFKGGTGEVFVYNKKAKEGYIFGEKLTKLSSVLSLLLDGNYNNNSIFPVTSSVKSIKTLLIIMQYYSECLSQRKNEAIENELFVNCNKKLAEKITTINTSDLLAAFLLADNLDITHGNTQVETDVLTILSQKVHHRLVSNLENVTIDQGEFELLHSLNDDLRKTIFSNKDKEILLQNYFNTTFHSNPVYYKTNALINKIVGIFFNADKSRLLYTGMVKENKLWSNLFLMDVKAGKSLYEDPRMIYLSPCWIDNNVFAYIQYGSNVSNKLLIYDCFRKRIIKEKIIYPDDEEFDKNFQILKMLCSNKKIIFLYYCNNNYGVALFDVPTDTIIYKKLSKISQVDPLLIVVKDSVRLLAYDDEGLSLYKASIKDNAISDFKFSWRKSIEFDFAIQLNEGVVSQDGSQIAFVGDDNIFLWSLTDFKEEPIKCSDIKNASSAVFSPDNKILIAACGKEKIVFIDTATGEKIDMPLSEKIDKNYAIALSEDGSTFAASGTNAPNDNYLFIMQLSLGWQERTKRFLEFLRVIRNDSFDKIILLKFLYDTSEGGKKPVQLTDAEKMVFSAIKNNESRQLLIDLGYIAYEPEIINVDHPYDNFIAKKSSFSLDKDFFEEPNPMTEEQGKQLKEELTEEIIKAKEEQKKPLSDVKSRYQGTPLQGGILQRMKDAWNAGGYYWNLFMKHFPSSG